MIPFHKPYITEDEIAAVSEVLRNGWLTMGKKTLEFEDRFREYLSVGHAVAVNSATAALHLSLRLIGLKEGDEVIVPADTFVATAEVVRYFRAVPVMVDIERDTHLIDASLIEEKITKRTRAIIPVHYAGQPCDMDAVMDIARRHNLIIIEDAAHSLPAWYREKKIGTIGDITCFSFYATKTLATGEGGMIVTGNAEWAQKASILRLHGIGRDAWKRYSSEGTWMYDVEDIGYKYNTTDICSAIGIEQLKKLEWMWRERSDIARKYSLAFLDAEELIPYTVKSDRVCGWHLYPLKLNIEALSINRSSFIEELKKRGIGTSVHFIPLYRFTYYKNMGYGAAEFPESEWVFDREISLPIFPGMKDETDQVIGNVLDIARKYRR